MRQRVLHTITVIVSAIILTGCFEKTLEDTVSSSDLRKMEENFMDGNDVFTDTRISVIGNDITYEMEYAEELTESEKTSIRNSIRHTSIPDTITALKHKWQEWYDIRPETITFICYTQDGDILFSIDG